jgi:hypothetical protein
MNHGKIFDVDPTVRIQVSGTLRGSSAELKPPTHRIFHDSYTLAATKPSASDTVTPA